MELYVGTHFTKKLMKVKKSYAQQDWLKAIHKGSNKKRFGHCVSSKNQVTYVRAIQGHTGGPR